MHEEYLSIKEFGDLLGVSRATVNRWRADGIAPTETKIGKVVRFKRSDVLAWAESFETGNAA